MRTGVAHLLYYPMCPLLQCVTHALQGYLKRIIMFFFIYFDVGQLSKDRWKIFQIRDEDLLDATEKYV